MFLHNIHRRPVSWHLEKYYFFAVPIVFPSTEFCLWKYEIGYKFKAKKKNASLLSKFSKNTKKLSMM